VPAGCGRQERALQVVFPSKTGLLPPKIFENCYGIFGFLCYIRALSKGRVFRMRESKSRYSIESVR
jgi:hypothetical protein